MNAQVVHYAIQYASLRARMLSATAGFPLVDVDDARQDLLLDCVRRWPRFDSGRGASDGFIRGVMRNHATALIARRSRTACHEVFAEDLSAPESENTTDVLDLVHCEDPTISLHLSLDVKRVLRQLPPRLQSLAELLTDLPVAEVCVVMGKSRSRTYQLIRELRTAFTAAGLAPSRVRPSSAGPRCHRRPSDSRRKVNR